MRCISLAKLFGKKNHVFLSHQNSDQNLVKKILKVKEVILSKFIIQKIRPIILT